MNNNKRKRKEIVKASMRNINRSNNQYKEVLKLVIKIIKISSG